jgi:8-oxo-dGTP diphosphatase
MSKDRFGLITDVHLFLRSEDKILLLKRQNTGYQDGNYSVIAGHLEQNETISKAMIREAEEEANILIKPNDLQLVHVMHHKSNNDRIAIFFTAHSWQREILNMEPEKCAELAWYVINILPMNVVPYVKFAIESYQKEILYSEFGWG